MTYDEMRTMLIAKGYDCITDSSTHYLVNDMAVSLGYSYYHRGNEIFYYRRDEQK